MIPQPAASTVPPTFPLERPRIRRRRRRLDPVIAESGLPYFLCGNENRLVAYAATADASVLRIGNPILIIGPTGCGKTAVAMHLAARAGIQIGIEDGSGGPAETIYIPASDFARDYATAIEVDDLESLQQRLLRAPVLIIDDLEHFADKSAAQSELGRRIDDRAAAAKLTLVTARRMPNEIAGLESSLVSRVLPGLTIPLVYPIDSTRRRLIAEYAIALDVELEPGWIEILDQALPESIAARSIESTIRSLDLASRMESRPVDLPMIQSVLDSGKHRKQVSMDQIIRVVARQFQLKTAEIKSPSRQRTTVRARSLAMWLCKKLAGQSTHRIGDHFGGRDHTTVMHAIRKIDGSIGSDTDLQRMVDTVEEKLLG